MAKTPSPNISAASTSFEDALRELESIVDSMEKGNLDLDPSLAAYQRGMELLKLCQDKLSAAESRIRIFDQGAFSDIKLGETEQPDAD